MKHFVIQNCEGLILFFKLNLKHLYSVLCPFTEVYMFVARKVPTSAVQAGNQTQEVGCVLLVSFHGNTIITFKYPSLF